MWNSFEKYLLVYDSEKHKHIAKWQAQNLIAACCLVTKLCRTLLWPHGLWPTSLLCPWYSPGKNTGVGCHFLLQGIFPIQGSNPTLSPALQADSLLLSHRGNPLIGAAAAAAAAAKSLQSCTTLCDPIDGSPPGSSIPGILQARTLQCVAISFSNAWKWKATVKSLSHVWLLATPWTAAYPAPPSMEFSSQEYWSGVPLPSPL